MPSEYKVVRPFIQECISSIKLKEMNEKNDNRREDIKIKFSPRIFFENMYSVEIQLQLDSFGLLYHKFKLCFFSFF